MRSITATTGVASTTTSLPCTASAGFVCPSSIAPFSRARSSTGARSLPTIRPRNLCFLSASPSEPPIRPLPMMVICRMGMGGIVDFRLPIVD